MLIHPRVSLRKTLLVLAITTFTYGANAKEYKPVSGEPSRLTELRGRLAEVNYNPANEGAGKARFAAVSQAAFSWGSQEGLYWRYTQIQQLLDKNALSLHTIFDFSKFIVDGKMLMPSVIEAERIYEQRSETSARTVKISYTLAKPASIVPQPPTWQDYLIRQVDEPIEPHAVVFPRDEQERWEWHQKLTDGWEQGVEQANSIFEHDLRVLNKDVEGMYRFRKLYTMGVVSMPSMASSEYPTITFDDGKTLNVNDIVYEINAPAEFEGSDKWNPYVRASVEGRIK